MTTIAGSPDEIHATASSYLDRSTAAGSQASSVMAAAAALPPSVDIGPSADAMRAFAGHLRTGMAAVAAAYDRVGAMLRQVARAVEEAQATQKAADQAKQQLAAATAKQLSAEAALEAARAAGTTGPAGPFSLTLGVPSPAQQAAVAQAEQELAQATRAVEEATRVNQRAQQRFHQAAQRRTQVMRAFEVLCEEAAVLAMRSIPQAPANLLDIAAVEELRSEAVTLLDLPLLTTSGYSLTHLGAVEHALLTRDTTDISRWSDGLLRPAHHGGGGLLNWLDHHVPVAGPLAKGFVDGTVATATGLWQLSKLTAENLAALPPGLGTLVPGGQLSLLGGLMPAGFRQRVWHLDGQLLHGLEQAGPVGVLKSAVGWDVFRRNAFEGIGNLLPALVGVVATKGAGAAADLSTSSAGTLLYRAGELADLTPTLLRAGDLTSAERVVYGADALTAGAKQAVDRAILLKRVEGTLEKGGYVTDGASVAGVPLSAAQGRPSDDPAAPGLALEWGAGRVLP